MSRLAPVLRVIGLIATLATIATLEYGAGQAAGWGWLAAGVPLALDPFVLGVLLASGSALADRLFALALVEFTVVVSAIAGEHKAGSNVVLGAVLATALVVALWRQDETIRREHRGTDEVTALRVALEEATAQATQVEAGMRRAVAEAVAAAIAEQETLRVKAVAEAVAAERAKKGGTDRADTPLQPERVATDAELADVIAEVLDENPKAGRPTVVAALKAKHLTPGKGERIANAIAAHKRGAIHAVPTSAAL